MVQILKDAEIFLLKSAQTGSGVNQGSYLRAFAA
jgi:hypothetical protein